MSTNLSLPHFSATQADAVLALWLKEVGEPVAAGEVVCQITIDKVTLDIESPVDGVLRHQHAQLGELLAGGALLGLIGEVDEDIPAHQLQRLTPPRLLTPCPIPAFPPEEADEIDIQDSEPEPLDAMRQTIARRMTISKQAAPHFYVTSIVDMSGAVTLRQQLKSESQRVTYNDMLIKACGLALRKIPALAAVYTPAGIISRTHMNIGFACAVKGSHGLVVPVIRDADKTPLVDIAAATKDLAARARDNRLPPEDYAGGVFSVTNLGTYEVEEFGAIINPGEAAILSAGKVAERPWVVDGKVTVRPVMRITLSSDHRVINGALAAKFNGAVKNYLERPAKFLLEKP